MVRRSDDVERRMDQSTSLWPDGRRRSPGHDGRKTPRGRRSELGQRLLSLNSDRSELKSESRLWSLREKQKYGTSGTCDFGGFRRESNYY